MPVVEISYERLQSLVGDCCTREQISSMLPFLGLDIESEHNDMIRVEYSPNRPDYSTDFGIALGLQGLLGVNMGMVVQKIKRPRNYDVIVSDSEISNIRPYVTGIVALGGDMDNQSIKQLMTMQEDLHMGLGRKRKRTSIGIHDLDCIQFPLQYTCTSRECKFAPLGHDSNIMSISDILSHTDVGRHYGELVAGHDLVPIIFDDNCNVISFPPIINSALTTVTSESRNLLVEITGTSKSDAENMLAVVAVVLQSAGFSLERLNVSGAGNSTPELSTRHMELDPALANTILGLNLTKYDIVSALRRSRLGATVKNNMIRCAIPAYRFDILGQMDLVEEVALGYGMQNLTPILTPSGHIGEVRRSWPALDALDNAMIGLGFFEAQNSSLSSVDVLYTMVNRKKPDTLLSVIDSKSQEHTVLRDCILPILLENLSKNIHEPYPQKLFETGTVFFSNSSISERYSLAAVYADTNADYTGIKSVLMSCLSFGFGIKVTTPATVNPMFSRGRCADVVYDGVVVGSIGEIAPEVMQNHRLRMPVAGFELSLSETILKSYY